MTDEETTQKFITWKDGIIDRSSGELIEIDIPKVCCGRKLELYENKYGSLDSLKSPVCEHAQKYDDIWQNYVVNKIHLKEIDSVSHCETDSYGTKVWRNKNNLCHRENGPAIELANGRKEWWINGNLHREDGPAIELANGRKEWWINGNLHREDGPAIILADCTKVWYINGRYHREDGPAIEHADGTKYWYLNGKQFTEKEFNKFLDSKKKESKSLSPSRLTPSGKEDKSMAQEKNGSATQQLSPSFSDMVKKDFEEAAYRVASTQMVNGVKLALIKVLEQKGHDSAQVKAFKDLMDTDFGSSLVSLALGLGFTYAPVLSEDPRAKKMAEEFRVNGMAVAGNAIVDIVVEHLMPVVNTALNSLPKETPSLTEKLRVKHDELNQEEHPEEPAPLKAAKAQA